MKSRSQKSGTQRPNTPRIHTKTNTKNNECLNTLQSLENIIINLKENNIDSTIQSIMQYFDNSYSYTFCATICEITFSFFCASTTFSLNLLLKFLNDFANTVNKENINIYKIFSKICIDSVNKDQYYYIMDKMIKEKLIDYNMVCPSIKKNSVYMAHYTYPKEFQFSEKRTSSIYDFIKRNKNLRENYWALHEEYVEEGHNPDKIAKIIRNDEVEKLQELSSQTNFNFNQCIDTSPYERFSFANTNIVKLIDYAAFFGSTKCFRYLLLNKADAYRTGKFAVAGGNLEIIHICEQNNSTFEDAYETAIMFHQNDIFKYLYENQIPGKINFNKDQTTKLLHNCVFYDNYEILLFLEEEGLKFDEVIIFDIMCKNNIFLIKHLFDMNGIPPYGFYLCARNGNVEIFNFLKKYKEININAKYIYTFYFKFV